MNRQYHLRYLREPKKAKLIMKEIKKLREVKFIHISDALDEMEIGVEEKFTSSVMEKVVNICHKIGNGCEISYKFI